MSAHRPLSAEARTFRERILRQTWPTDGRVAHLTADDCAVICPVCDREIRPPPPIRRDGDQIVRDPPVPVEARRSGHVLKRLLLEPGAPQQARSSPGSRRAPRLDDRVGEANIPERGLE